MDKPQDQLPEFGQNSLLQRAGQPAELAPVYVFFWRRTKQAM